MLTIVMPYYNNPTMLRRHLAEWADYPDDIQAIVVDDASHEAANDVLRTMRSPIPLEIYRVLVDVPWHQDGAANLGMDRAPKGWCLLTDIDHLLPAESACRVIDLIAQKRLQRSIAYRPLRRKVLSGGSTKPYHRHPNSYLIHRRLFWKAGGYDESFSGYYGKDRIFRTQLLRVGTIADTESFELELYGREVIPDASTRGFRSGETPNTIRKGSKYAVSQNKDLRARKKAREKQIKPLQFSWERVR